jgi:hypothetical protein
MTFESMSLTLIGFAQTDGYDDIEDAVDVLSLYFSLGSMQFGRVRSASCPWK